jgi:hypothetical protein
MLSHVVQYFIIALLMAAVILVKPLMYATVDSCSVQIYPHNCWISLSSQQGKRSQSPDRVKHSLAIQLWKVSNVLLYRVLFYYFLYYWWGGTKSRYCGHLWPIVPAPDDRWGWLWSNWWNEDWQGKPKYLEKTCLSATLSTTNPTWPDPGSNPGHRGGKPATKRLSYGAAPMGDLLKTLFHTALVPSKSII